MSFGVSVMLGSRGRPKQFREFLRAIEKTKKGEVEVLFYLDEDDKTKEAYPTPTILGPRITVCKRFEQLFKLAKYDYWMLVGDDQFCRTPGWDVAMMDLIPLDRIGLVHCADGWKETVSVLFFHRRMYELTGLFPMDFEHFGPDTYLADVARSIDRLFRIQEVFIEHRHYRNSKTEKDETYAHPRDSGMSLRDHERLRKHQEKRMKEDIRILRAEIERFSQDPRAVDAARERARYEQAKAL